MVNPGQLKWRRAEAKKAGDPKFATKGKQGKGRGATPPKAALQVTRPGGALPPASNIREGGQANANTNQASTSDGANPRHLPQWARQCHQRRRLLAGGRTLSPALTRMSQKKKGRVRLRSRTPPDRRTPDEPSAPPKAKGTAVKSKAKIVVPQKGGGRPL